MKNFIPTALLASALTSFVHAQQATEFFDYAGGTLLNTTTSGSGWSTGWKANNALTTNLAASYTVQAGSIDSAANPNPASGGSFFQDAGSNLLMYRGLSNPIDWSIDGTHYLSFMTQWTGNSSSASSRVWLRLTGTSAQSDTVVGFIGDGSNTNQLLAQVRNNGTRVTGTTAYAAATDPADRDNTVIPYYVVAKITTVSTGLDTISMSVYAPGDTVPTSEPLTWDLSAQNGRSDTTSVIGFDAQIFFGGRNAGFDELRLGDSFTSVIPEPSAASSLVGVITIFLVIGLRRRR